MEEVGQKRQRLHEKVCLNGKEQITDAVQRDMTILSSAGLRKAYRAGNRTSLYYNDISKHISAILFSEIFGLYQRIPRIFYTQSCKMKHSSIYAIHIAVKI